MPVPFFWPAFRRPADYIDQQVQNTRQVMADHGKTNAGVAASVLRQQRMPLTLFSTDSSNVHFALLVMMIPIASATAARVTTVTHPVIPVSDFLTAAYSGSGQPQ